MGREADIVGLVGRPGDAIGPGERPGDEGTGWEGRLTDVTGLDIGTLLGMVGLDGRPMVKFGLGDVGRGDAGRTDMAGSGLCGNGGDAAGGRVGMRCTTGGCLVAGIAAFWRIGGLAGGLASTWDVRGDLSSSDGGIPRAPWGCRTWGMPGT